MLTKELTGKLSHKASGAEPGIGAEREAETDRVEGDEQDDQAARSPRRWRAPCRTTTRVTPNSRKLQVASSWICCAIGIAGLSPPRNSASAGRSAKRAGATSSAGDEEIVDDAGAGDRADPVPFAGADILRGHRADRGAERHRRHLEIGPQLHDDAEGGGGVDALAVDQPDRRQRRGGDDDHLQAHRQALADDRSAAAPDRAADSAARRRAAAAAGRAGRCRRAGRRGRR